MEILRRHFGRREANSMTFEYKTKKDIESALNVSMATVNNWLKTGLIQPPGDPRGYSQDEFDGIIDSITSAGSARLKMRANRSLTDRKYICDGGLSSEALKAKLQKALSVCERSGYSTEQKVLAMCVAVLTSAGLLRPGWTSGPYTAIERFLWLWLHEVEGDTRNAEGDTHNVGGDARSTEDDTHSMLTLFAGFAIPAAGEDFLGAFYQSLQSVAAKSKRGAYYTPPALLKGIRISAGRKVLDPCCGSGGILLKVLSKRHSADDIFAWDIDRTALKICRVNLCLFFGDPEAEPHISRRDAVFANGADLDRQPEYDVIITNPPWGSKFTRAEKQRLLAEYPALKTTESFSIVLHNTLQKLSASGRLIFFLPHAFLNVAAHGPIRNYIIRQNATVKIKLLGNAFKGVMSEAIRLEIVRCERPARAIRIYASHGREPVVIARSILRPPGYIIPATATNEDLKLITAIFARPHVLLKDNARFALGIVTGSNETCLVASRSAQAEPIYRGKDINAFCFQQPALFIDYNPAALQQTAPLELYRQTKIAYRFISDKLVCALDRGSRLLLNSANLFIPTLDYPPESIVALFNSRLYTYLYRRIFHSRKVLRSHLETLPLPVLDAGEHQALKEWHDRLSADDCPNSRAGRKPDNMPQPDNTPLSDDTPRPEWDERFNQAVYALFGLTAAEIALIESDCNLS